METKISIGIDPSINYTGIAVIKACEGSYEILNLKTITSDSKMRKSLDRITRVKLMWLNSINHLGDYTSPIPDVITIEQPRQWGAYKSQAAGSRNDLLDLTLLVGLVAGYSFYKCDLMLFVPPNKWKGQLPKAVTQQRLKKYFPDEPWGTDHESDALGLALHGLGVTL